MPKREEIFEQMQKNVSEQDISTISNKINSMNHGPISKIWDKVMSLWTFIKDPNASKWGKGMAIAALLYLISPLDAVPDIIPVLGLSDDVAIILSVVTKLAADLQKYNKK